MHYYLCGFSGIQVFATGPNSKIMPLNIQTVGKSTKSSFKNQKFTVGHIKKF